MLPPVIPEYVFWIFTCTTFLTLIIFLFAARDHSGSVIILAVALLSITGIMAKNEFFLKTGTPPRLMLGILPSFLIIIMLFATTAGRRFIDKLSPVTLTYLHVVRVPVEMVLFWLCMAKAVPELMTFEGRNFDILAGVTAPFVAFLMSRKKINNKIVIAWNVLCIGLLLNIVINAILAAPFPFQQFAFDQPNVAVLYFPYVWLPCFIVPAVLFAHLATLRHLTKRKSSDGK